MEIGSLLKRVSPRVLGLALILSILCLALALLYLIRSGGSLAIEAIGLDLQSPGTLQALQECKDDLAARPTSSDLADCRNRLDESISIDKIRAALGLQVETPESELLHMVRELSQHEARLQQTFGALVEYLDLERTQFSRNSVTIHPNDEPRRIYRLIQAALWHVGCHDGVFDGEPTRTRLALDRFQEIWVPGLGAAERGHFGPKTVRALRSAMAEFSTQACSEDAFRTRATQDATGTTALQRPAHENYRELATAGG